VRAPRLTPHRVLRGLTAAALVAVISPAAASSSAGALYAGPIPQAGCDAGSLPETGISGRVSSADVTSGRAAKGYRCNTQQVGHFGATGGFQVHRYVDHAGHECAYFDSTLLFPKDAATNAAEGVGVYAMDMSHPAHPVHTATLSTPAMLSPHESLRLNAARGLLVADMGYPSTNPGFVDVYDVKADCRHPVLRSSTPLGILGHESAFSRDGKTFYVTSASGPTVSAVDLTDPAKPSVVGLILGHQIHGMSVSDDGTRLYAADIGDPGLTIFDVSQIQHRAAVPQVSVVSHLTWPQVSIPQNALPVTIRGKHYLVEVDEYTSNTTRGIPGYDPKAQVGAARMIDISNEKAPRVVSNMRLAVNNTAARAGDSRNDPGAQNAAQGYAGHYCAVPQETDPTIIACSFIVSGLRLFDIKDPVHPRELGYFNGPVTSAGTPAKAGNFAMSALAFAPARHEVWYTDGNSGFYVVRLTGAALAAQDPKSAAVRRR